MPRTRLAPRCVIVASITSGLSQGMFDGEARSSSCRAPKATSRSWCAETPGTLLAASCHHLSASVNACTMLRCGQSCQPDAANRGSSGWCSPAGTAPGTPGRASADSRAAARHASAASSGCRPGSLARCANQSHHASDSATGDRPPVSRACHACSVRSRLLKPDPRPGASADVPVMAASSRTPASLRPDVPTTPVRHRALSGQGHPAPSACTNDPAALSQESSGGPWGVAAGGRGRQHGP